MYRNHEILKSQKGFTIFELVIVSGLFGLIIASILTSMMLFTRTLQFTNEQLYLNTEYDKLVSVLEAKIKRMKAKEAMNNSLSDDMLLVGGTYYRIVRQGSDYYLMHGTNLTNMRLLVKLRFKELKFQYRYYIGNQEITTSSRPLSATPGSLKVVELIGKVILPASNKEADFYKSFLVEYQSEFF